MVESVPMRQATRISSFGALASTLAVLVVAGCAESRWRLDPSGEHVFIHDPPPPAVCPPGTVPATAPVPTPAPATAAPGGLQPIPMTQPPGAACPPGTMPVTGGVKGGSPVFADTKIGTVPAVSPLVSPYSDAAVTLAPCSRVAPVGAEVILVAGVRGGDNYLRTNRRLDWSIAPGSVGQFSDIGRKQFEDYLVADFSRPRITSPTMAVGVTTRVAERVGPRGCPGDSIYIARGQTWIALRSPVEGVSQVTVVAPEVVVPAERAKTATIYWYDAQYSFPEPVVTPPGTKGTLTTTVWKLTNRCPRAGWIVRYELTGGPQAIFVPSASTAVEMPTDAAGRASVEIVQKDPSPGTSQIRVQLFRPADQCGPRFLVREGCTAVSWTDAAAPAAAPAAPALPGPVTTTPPAMLSPPTVTPPPSGTPSLGATPPSEARPTPPAPSVLDVRVTQRMAAAAGSNVTFTVEVMNRGTTTAREVTVTDTYDAGLEPQTADSSSGRLANGPITKTLTNLLAGETRQFSLTFRVTKAGRFCHRVEAIASDGGRASQEYCFNAAPAAEAPRPSAVTPSPPREGAGVSPAVPSRLVIKVDNRNLVRAGDYQQFEIRVTNEGEATENDILVTAQLPQGSQLVPTESFGPEPGMTPQQEAGRVSFGLLAALPPKTPKSYRISVTTSRSGPLTLRAEATSRQSQPVSNSKTVEVSP